MGSEGFHPGSQENPIKAELIEKAKELCAKAGYEFVEIRDGRIIVKEKEILPRPDPMKLSDFLATCEEEIPRVAIKLSARKRFGKRSTRSRGQG